MEKKIKERDERKRTTAMSDGGRMRKRERERES